MTSGLMLANTFDLCRARGSIAARIVGSVVAAVFLSVVMGGTGYFDPVAIGFAGFGLALTKAFATMLGDVRVDSVVGRGSIFTVNLTAIDVGPKSPAEAHAGPIRSVGHRAA